MCFFFAKTSYSAVLLVTVASFNTTLKGQIVSGVSGGRRAIVQQTKVSGFDLIVLPLPSAMDRAAAMDTALSAYSWSRTRVAQDLAE
jgi:hypothetical protein